MRKISVGRLTLGLILAVLGIALLLDINYGRDTLQTVVKYWPVALILLGLEYVVASRDPESTARVSIGSIIAMAVVLCLAWVYVEAPVSFLGFQGFGFSYPGQEEYVIELPVNEAFGTASTRVNVEAIHDVTITGSADNSVVGTARITVRARTIADAKRVAEQLRVVGRPSGSTLYIEISKPSDLTRFISIQPSFVLTMPSTGSVTSNTISGDTSIAGITGDVSVDSISGNILVDGAPSSVSANAISGNVHVTLNSGMKSVYAKTISGEILINAPEGTGGNMTFSSVSGNVETRLSGIQVTSSPGRRTASGRFGTGDTTIQLNTVSGGAVIR
ncbi:MAG TPA: DUF4097 family beta strand repeat-containing protein [Chloroflexota bacterium]|nr:DUF4097 family beta strand repeat-containing protein [Chloroflexota bacterium]